MVWKVNKWIKYLEGYCQGKNQIQDEYVRKVASNLGLEQPINVGFEWQKQIIEQFNSEDAQGVIILTGTAGDGKTKLCRDIVKQIDGESFDEEVWNSKSYFCNDNRTIVKDFSELQKEKEEVIDELIDVLCKDGAIKPILIAVNDGILVEEITRYIEGVSDRERKVKAKLLREIIEDKINLGYSECSQENLIKLINLSKLNAKDNFSLIIKAIIDNSGWDGCIGCEGSENNRCPIYSKYLLLKENQNIRDNLSDIILLLQLNNEHFTIRELLNLTTNTILASAPKAKALKTTAEEFPTTTFSCKKISRSNNIEAYETDTGIEVGFWGMNLGPHKMLNSRPYSEINKLMFGEVSTNYWDNYLKEKHARELTIPLDHFNHVFNSKHGSKNLLETELWTAVVRRSRMQLFCYQIQDEKAYSLQRYNSFGYYKEKIYEELQQFSKCEDIELISLIILALNRVFHGRFINEYSGKDRLYVPESGQGSITPISIFHSDEIRDRDIFITKVSNDLNLKGSRIEPEIVFVLDRDVSLKLNLTVELFDFLYKVADGAPPNTTNPRLYKKLLIFRSKLASRMGKISRGTGKRIETYAIKDGEFKPSILKVNHG